MLWAAAPLAALWAEARNPDGVAVIIGNKTYQHEVVPEVPFAHRDAAAFKRYVIEVLRFDSANIIELHDASQADMESAFGNERRHEGLLWSYLNPYGTSDVVVFYSGHGVQGRGAHYEPIEYLLPTDAHPATPHINGYSLNLLYQNLGTLHEARTIAVYLDAGFGGLVDFNCGVAGCPSKLPAFETWPVKMAVLAATWSWSGELALWDREAQHGLFTHHLLDALYGTGDADGDGCVTAAEAKHYLRRHMTRAARRRFKSSQEATLIGASELILGCAPVGGYPERPLLPVAGHQQAAHSTSPRY